MVFTVSLGNRSDVSNTVLALQPCRAGILEGIHRWLGVRQHRSPCTARDGNRIRLSLRETISASRSSGWRIALRFAIDY